MADKHMWEVDHSYYCSDQSWNGGGESCFEFKSWQDFMAEMGDADMDYNLIFRWDWKEMDDDGGSTYKGDDNYRNGKLHLYQMQQRKGRFVVMIVEVCRADEKAVRKYMEPRWNYLRDLWEPIAAMSTPNKGESK
jgi:hypothetical protein